jgi:hypothetical protein
MPKANAGAAHAASMVDASRYSRRQASAAPAPARRTLTATSRPVGAAAGRIGG